MNREDPALLYKIALGLCPAVGPTIARKLLAYSGGVENIFKAKKNRLLRIPGVGNMIAEGIHDVDLLRKAEDELMFIEKNGIRSLFFLDDDYPERLKQCDDGPVVLFWKGKGEVNPARSLAIVGTRKGTPEGKERCDQIIQGLSQISPSPQIISGLAYGIDIAAHRASLKYGLSTVGILAHGLNKLYPPTHRSVATEMLQSGGLVSEFHTLTTFDRKNFIRRNRIIAGLADAVVVVESGLEGGALITAGIAQSYNREVFALPGRPEDEWSTGCNELIRSNAAGLIRNSGDLISALGWDQSRKQTVITQARLFVELTTEEQAILDILQDQGKCGIDMIAQLAGLAIQKVNALIISMEFAGLLQAFPGKQYALKS